MGRHSNLRVILFKVYPCLSNLIMFTAAPAEIKEAHKR
jgi:hypothetical protein